MYPHQRAEIRLRVRANALLSFDRNEGKARVRNLSAGGVEVYRPEPRPRVGARAQIVLQGGPLPCGIETWLMTSLRYWGSLKFFLRALRLVHLSYSKSVSTTLLAFIS